MSEAKHTAGPLSVRVPKKSGGALGDAGDRGIQTADGVILGEAWTECPGPGGTKVIADADANARLWAAAPEMLEALKAIGPLIAAAHKSARNKAVYGPLQEAMQAVNAVISKAEGR